MNDMISRQAAIDEWKNDFKGYVNSLNIPRDDYNGIMAYIDELPSAQPWWITDVKNILAYLDDVVHPIVSPENWNVYSELHDMVSGLLKPWEGGQNNEKIKPCPFCGCQALLVEDKCQYKIFCTKCDCQYGWCEDKDDTIRGWNRREGVQE